MQSFYLKTAGKTHINLRGGVLTVNYTIEVTYYMNYKKRTVTTKSVYKIIDAEGRRARMQNANQEAQIDGGVVPKQKKRDPH